MSHVTNLLVLPGSEDDPTEGEAPWFVFVNEKLHTVLGKVDGHAGGHKGLEADVYLVALNYVADGTIHEAMTKAPWQNPTDVRYLIKGQNDVGWTLYGVREMSRG